MEFFTITGWLLAIAAIALSIYLYIRAKGVRKISGEVVLREQIPVGACGPQGAVVGGEKIERDASLVLIEFRHVGNVTILANDLRKPLRVRVQDKAEFSPIWAHVYSKGTRSNDTLRSEIRDGEVHVRWEYLDPGDTFAVSVVGDGAIGEVNFDAHIAGDGTVIKKAAGWSRDRWVSYFFIVTAVILTGPVSILLDDQDWVKDIVRFMGWGVSSRLYDTLLVGSLGSLIATCVSFLLVLSGSQVPGVARRIGPLPFFKG